MKLDRVLGTAAARPPAPIPSATPVSAPFAAAVRSSSLKPLASRTLIVTPELKNAPTP